MNASLTRGPTWYNQVRARFQWQGMLDSYISYICLARAVKIFSKYGEAQVPSSLLPLTFQVNFKLLFELDDVLVCYPGERPHRRTSSETLAPQNLQSESDQHL